MKLKFSMFMKLTFVVFSIPLYGMEEVLADKKAKKSTQRIALTLYVYQNIVSFTPEIFTLMSVDASTSVEQALAELQSGWNLMDKALSIKDYKLARGLIYGQSQKLLSDKPLQGNEDKSLSTWATEGRLFFQAYKK